ncbi:unnamed protein product [Microthlaspi erraticum]|jgi:cystatin-related protein|uniref:Cystatin domain-containing protein n=1 Tax=Microthlaspi erraticum TaxID=1685480 RepID=A0A6D2L6X9_9BRAS|nr:unnamed protein product [Microthlaspi erraticum]
MGSSCAIDYEINTNLFDPLCVRASIMYLPKDEPEEVKLLMERIRGKEEDLGHNHTVRDEYALINEQIRNSQGFDVDFSKFRYLFDFFPAFLDETDVADAPETDGEFFGRLCKEAIEDYNKKEGTSFEFVEVEKANVYSNSGYVYFITFVAKDTRDHNQTKIFQAKVIHVYCREIEHSFCRLKPGQEDSKNVAKKLRVQ